MKVWVVIDSENITLSVFSTREKAVADTLEHFASLEIEVHMEDDDFWGKDDCGGEARWAKMEEHEVY